jgi:hypothetical protein
MVGGTSARKEGWWRFTGVRVRQTMATFSGCGLRDVRDELGVDERCDDEEEMAGDKKLSGP